MKLLLLLLILISGCAARLETKDQQDIQYIDQPNAIPDDSMLRQNNEEVNSLKLTSTAFENNGNIPSKYTCDGEDVSPPLKIEGIPEGTESLILTMDDPDAPAGVWDHWIVWNIPATTTEIKEGQEPNGIHGRGTSGNLDYHGPCPPGEEHRYVFKLYAINTKLDLKEGAAKIDVVKAMTGHILSSTVLTGKYQRK